MNRADRRIKQKAGISIKTEPTFNLKRAALDKVISNAKEIAKKEAMAAALKEIDRQILERDMEYSLDLDSMVLWTLAVSFGFGKIRLERFYREMIKEHSRMRERYEMDDAYPERFKLKQLYGVDVELLNNEFKKEVSPYV